MIDVHPPDHPLHGIRDFVVHLLTITVGLLIALGLENLVEWRHHVHLRHEAENKIRHELQDNQNDVRKVLQAIPSEQAKFAALLVYLKGRAAGSKAVIDHVNIGVTISVPQDASWQTAAATGALAYMNYDEVARFASAYQMQKKLDGVQDATMAPLVVLLGTFSSSDLDKMSKDDAKSAVQQVREAMGHVENMREIATDLQGRYAAALAGN